MAKNKNTAVNETPDPAEVFGEGAEADTAGAGPAEAADIAGNVSVERQTPQDLKADVAEVPALGAEFPAAAAPDAAPAAAAEEPAAAPALGGADRLAEIEAELAEIGDPYADRDGLARERHQMILDEEQRVLAARRALGEVSHALKKAEEAAGRKLDRKLALEKERAKLLAEAEQE